MTVEASNDAASSILGPDEDTMDPLAEALREAETLMESLAADTTTEEPDLGGGTGSFAIDSDGEDDDDDDDLGLNAHSANQQDATKSDPTATPWHPLHDAFLNSSNSQTNSLPSVAAPTVGGPSSTHAPSSWTTAPGDGALFSSTTSRFASQLASMAQRAATQVQTAVASSSSSVPIMATTSTTPLHHHPHTSVPILASSSSPLPQHSQPPIPSTTVELDAEAKQILIQTHVGDLISGERIIMFLTNLLHVSDSSGFQSSSAASGWCGVMTYYRLILFATHPTPVPERPAHWNAAAWPHQPGPTVLELPLASIDRVEKSVFTVTSTTNSSNSNYTPNNNSAHQTNGAAGMMMMVLGNNNNTSTNNLTPNNNMLLNNSYTSGVTTMSQQHMGVVVHCKVPYGRQIRFSTAQYPDTTRAYEALQTYAFPGRRNLGYLFAFESKREQVMASIQTDTVTGQSTVTLEPCPRRFDAEAEFQRQFRNAQQQQQQQQSTSGVTDETVVAGEDLPSLATPPTTSLEQPNNNPWSIWTTTNTSYQLCLSYPSIIAGPASLDERLYPDAARIVRQCAAFRSEGRLPALTWCGPGGASIWRCSQPKVGLQGNRSTADELFLQHIAERAAAANALVGLRPDLPPPSVLVQLTGSTDLTPWMPVNNNSSNNTTSSHHQQLHNAPAPLKILDLRPRSAAMANRTGGYGYENTSNYNGCTLQFCNITNIHGVRDSYQKLSALCLSATASDLTFATAVEDTKWLSHIRLLWSAAWETCYWTHVHRIPVVLHCSHGWDRTSQVAALAQLLLDGHYRTKKGFACLCEKEFMSFGHPFHTRCGHGEGKASNNVGLNSSSSTTTTQPALDEGQISPIFLQFLDCVYQIVRQYPDCFEFNPHYLYCVSEHIYSCRFGNFLCDTERERELVAGLRQRTHSLWDYLEQDPAVAHSTTHPHFNSDDASGVLLVPLPALLRQITLWTERHCRSGPKVTTPWTWQQPPAPQPPASTSTSTKKSETTIPIVNAPSEEGAESCSTAVVVDHAVETVAANVAE